MAHTQGRTTPRAEQSWESVGDLQSIEEFLKDWPPFFDPPLFDQHIENFEGPGFENSGQNDISQNGGTHVQNEAVESTNSVESTTQDEMTQFFDNDPWQTPESEQESEANWPDTGMDISSPEPVLQIETSSDIPLAISPSSQQSQTLHAGPSKSKTPRIREKKCPCSVSGCDRSFCFPKDLRRHDAVHVPDEEAPRPWKCHVEECPQSQRGYKRRDALLRHVRAKHAEGQDA